MMQFLQKKLTFISWCLLLVIPCRGVEPPPVVPIVDCHVHLWDIARPAGLGWIADDDQILKRSFLPEYHAPLAQALNIKAVVVVQAGQSLDDNQWNLDITAHNKMLYRGVVGNLSEVIGTDKFAPLFELLCTDNRYVGYRLSGRYQETLTEAFYRDLQLTADKGKTIDFLVGGYQLDEIATIAQRLPQLKIILDHFGNVRLSDQPLDPAWIKQFRAMARHKNIYCKVSALYGRVEKQPAPKDLAYYKPLLDLAYESFGEERLIFGSDWPVSRHTGDYASVIQLTKAYFDNKGRTCAEKVFALNALQFYGIPGF